MACDQLSKSAHNVNAQFIKWTWTNKPNELTCRAELLENLRTIHVMDFSRAFDSFNAIKQKKRKHLCGNFHFIEIEIIFFTAFAFTVNRVQIGEKKDKCFLMDVLLNLNQMTFSRLQKPKFNETITSYSDIYIDVFHFRRIIQIIHLTMK